MTDIFDVIADEARRDILRILLESTLRGSGEVSVSDLVSATGLSQPTVSKQLKVLREAGVVAVREDGQHRYYHLDATPLEQLEKWVVPFLGTPVSDPSGERTERPLGDETLAVAASVGRTAAEATHRVTAIWDDALDLVTSGVEKFTEAVRKRS
jgi:DNA-binding transcriptional ArsR family regulator